MHFLSVLFRPISFDGEKLTNIQTCYSVLAVLEARIGDKLQGSGRRNRKNRKKYAYHCNVISLYCEIRCMV